MPDDIAADLAEARAKIEATREALLAALVEQDGELDAIIARLDRLCVEVEWVDGRFDRPAVEGEETAGVTSSASATKGNARHVRT